MDLTWKLLDGVDSKDFMDQDCNCNNKTKVNGQCVYEGKCRKSIVVYKATCKLCDKYYIGNTQQKLKKRMDQHFGETVDHVNRGIKSDSLANHFAEHLANLSSNKDANRQMIRQMVKMEILCQGKAISSMKSFGKLSCCLFMKERLAILKMARKEPDKLINSRSEIYGACRHKMRFHRYTKNGNPSTDEGTNPERALEDITNTTTT